MIEAGRRADAAEGGSAATAGWGAAACEGWEAESLDAGTVAQEASRVNATMNIAMP